MPADNATSRPHGFEFKGSPICWCGENHPKPEGYPWPEDEWVPVTEADLDSLYLEAWLEPR